MEGVNMVFVSSGDSEDCKPFKSEILRGFITERLSTATRDILAVLERTVSGYEEQAAGLRREIDRQRSQLEEVLQPGVLQPGVLQPGVLQPRVLQPRVLQPGVLQPRVLQPGVLQPGVLQPRVAPCGSDGADLKTYDILVHADEDEDDHVEEEEEEEEAESADEDQEDLSLGLFDLRDPDYQIQNKRGSRVKGRRRKSDDVSLRVCLLQDANANILKKGVLKSPVQEVRCPRGLQEAEFLDLLRSSFPQLTEQFDAFTTDTTRKLKPLHLETMTPEKIQRAIKSRGRGRSALYVRVKAAKESQRSALRREDANDDTREETEEHGGPAERAERPQQHTDTKEEHPGTSEDEEWKPDEDDEEIQRMKPKLDSSETMNQNLPEPDNFCSNSGRQPMDFSACSDRESDDDGDEEWRPGEDEDEMEDRINKPHSSGENSGAPLSCRVCQALKGSTSMLIKHSWSHVEDPERLCGVCGEHSESAEELRSHLNTHRRTHSCDVCGKNFLTVVGLQEHATLHAMEKRFRCEVCGKAYASKNTLKSHQWEHVEDKPHRCDACHQSFAFKQQLRIHSRTHTGEKPYTCDLCGKSVSNLRSLSRHKLTHSGEKRYSCRDCGKRFVSLGGLKQHETIHTDRDRTHLCEICCKAFHKRAQLNVHMASHGDKKFMCDICGKGVSQKSKLKAHMRIHTGEKPYGCSDCGKRFNSSSYLTEHKLVHSGVKSHVCSVCGKTWSLRKFLKVHMRTHNGERPYKCSICDKGFTQNHCLKTHMKSHQGAAEDALMD